MLRVVFADRVLRRVYLASVLGGGGRGLGVANLFALIYLTKVLELPQSTTNSTYGALIVLSVPMPLIAGWLSDRIGRRPVIVGAYLGGAVGFAIFITAGASLLGLWVGLAVMGLFSFAEKPAAPGAPRRRDTGRHPRHGVCERSISRSRSGSARSGPPSTGRSSRRRARRNGLPIVFSAMAASFVAAAVVMLPVRDVVGRAAVRDLAPEPVEGV